MECRVLSRKLSAIKSATTHIQPVISNYDNIQTVPQFTVVPSWGFKRNISKKWLYEISSGIGYRHINYKSIGYTENKDETFLNLHLRIGYVF